ncbi:MAG TPA: PHB depolymerase family esterase [Casimicrobiaceae bacterium]
MKRLWLRIRAFVARAFARLLRREVAPGRFETGRAASWRGRVTTAPIAEPARDYLVYVPRGWSRWRRAPLLVLCHGCRQTAEEFAALTRIAERADRDGCLVLLPRQTTTANAWGCWNWFEANTERGAGEAAIVAAQVVAVRRHYRARRERVWVAGISSGGALAAVLGLRHPRLVRGVVVHSGLACGAAASAATALAVMRHGPDNDVARVGADARAAQRDDPPLAVALLAIQGDRDDVVAPINGAGLVAQYLRFNAHPAGDAGYRPAAALPPSDASSRESSGDGYPTRSDDWSVGGHVVVRHVAVEGLGHAWSGGDAAFPYADPRGPDALDLLARFATNAAA